MTPRQQAELEDRASTLRLHVLDLFDITDVFAASLAVADIAQQVAHLDKFVESCKEESRC